MLDAHVIYHLYHVTLKDPIERGLKVAKSKTALMDGFSVTLKDPIERGLKDPFVQHLEHSLLAPVTLKDPIERGLKDRKECLLIPYYPCSYTQRPDRKGTERTSSL